MKLKFTGFAHVRSFVKGDFTRHGLEGDDVKAVKFDANNNWVAEVPDAVGEWLIANDGEFKVVTDDEAQQPDTTRIPLQSTPLSALASPLAGPVEAAPGVAEVGARTSGRRSGRVTAGE